MLFRRPPPAPHAPFAALPINEICPGDGARRIAVHVHGALASGIVPVVGLAGYHRNMTDFTEFARALPGETHARQPIVLIDLAGRGRSTPLRHARDYSTVRDAADVLAVLDALGITRAIFAGMGHGGQVAMVIGLQRPRVVAGAILVDAGPVADSRGLVRLRNNLRHIEGLRTAAAAREAMRTVLASDYPGADMAQLDALAARVMRFDVGRRATPLYDRKLIARLDDFDFDDIFEPQWAMFDTLARTPLMLVRTQLTDLLQRETFEAMDKRHSDARVLTITGQGSPALLNGAEDIAAMGNFIRGAQRAAT